MKRVSWVRAIAFAVIAIPGAIAAHHSQAMFVETPVWVTGTVTRYRTVDPHVMIELQEAQPAGSSRKWVVEGPRRGRLDRILQNNGNIRDDQILKVGDRVGICGFPLKKDFAPERMYEDWPPEQGRFVHGQVIVLPDGRMQSWGPYGTIDNCVRSGDAAGKWSAFLNRDALAHDQWCSAMTYTRLMHHTPRALLDAINRELRVACG